MIKKNVFLEPTTHLLLASQPRSLLVSSRLLCEMLASFASTWSSHLETNSFVVYFVFFCFCTSNKVQKYYLPTTFEVQDRQEIGKFQQTNKCTYLCFKHCCADHLSEELTSKRPLMKLFASFDTDFRLGMSISKFPVTIFFSS